MKKFFSMAIVAIAAATMVSCGNSTPKANLKSNVDSLSYAYGLQYTQGFGQYLQQMGIDSIYMSEFYKGVTEGFNASDDKKRNAYYQGVEIGMRLNMMLAQADQQLTSEDSVKFLSRSNFLAGFINGAQEKNLAFPKEIADSLVNFLGNQISKENHDKVAKKLSKESDEFIAKKEKEAGVQKLPGGVLYKVIKQGEGEIPTATSKVKVFYEGKLIDGTVFDSSSKHGDDPIEFRADQVIKGWTEALTNMPKGSKWELYIPQELAYGERGAGQMIPPYSPLVFTVELVDFTTEEKAE
jgi:FKBP-type peptidyl-prolyl cis-trans isomerase FklB